MARVLAGIIWAFLLTLSPVPGAPGAHADEGQVDLLLVLAADVSRSVDDKEFKLQREGYAEAMRDPRVLRAMTGGPTGRIAVVFVEWASEFEQRVVVDWAVIAGERDAEEMSQRIQNVPRSFWGRTSISAAIEFSMGLLARCPFQSDRQVIDVSGDGTNNSGIEVTVARDSAVAKGVSINGLVIQSDEPMPTNPSHTHPPGGLKAYYEHNVIGGPGAFVLEAQSFETFGQLIISKLIKEIATLTEQGRTYE